MRWRIAVAVALVLSGLTSTAEAGAALSRIPESSSSFAVAPTWAPVGTARDVRSVTPCPSGSTTVEVGVWGPADSDAVEGRSETFPVAEDGSWSGTITPPSTTTGTAFLQAACGGQSYRQLKAYVTTSNAGLVLVSPEPTQSDCFCPSPRPATTVQDLGDGVHVGSTRDRPLTAPLVGVAVHPTTGLGYWLVATDGGVFSYGEAAFLGSTGDRRLNQPIVGIAATPSGAGYWLVAADGGIFTFGDAPFLGSTGSLRLNRPIVGMAPTPSGRGYWLVASDGGIFTFGDAAFHGSAGGIDLAAPIVAMTAPPSGPGYWLVARDGGVFTFGALPFHGSLGGEVTDAVSIASHGDGGYWIVRASGAAAAFGDAPDVGSCATRCEPFAGETRNFVAAAATPRTSARN